MNAPHRESINTPASALPNGNTNTPASALPNGNTNNSASGYDGGTPINTSDDLLNLIRAVRLMWKNRKWVAIGTGAITLLGILYALVATPVYVSEAVAV
ncbi:MAG: Wzz/FepE/Etk N-terminal domain-containing protein [Chitinispirillaceae bacterium]|jgi:hypothetical protein